MRNKIGSMFSLLLPLMVLIVMITIIISLSYSRTKLESGFQIPSKLQEMYNKERNFNFYFEKSSELASQQAFYKTILNLNTYYCKIKTLNGKTYVLWSENCKPEKEKIFNNFLNNFKKEFKKFSQEYYDETKIHTDFDFNLKNNKIICNGNKIKLNFLDKNAFSTYNFSYNFNPLFSLDLSELGINSDEIFNLYEILKKKLEKCKNKQEKYDVEKIKDCFLKTQLKNFDLSVQIFNDYVYFNLITKKEFLFFDKKSKMEKLQFRVCLKI